MKEIDKQAVVVWRERYPEDSFLSDDEILYLFGITLTFCLIRLGCAKDNFVSAIMDTKLLRFLNKIINKEN